MVKVRNLAKERLQAGEFAIGVGLRQARAVDIGKIMKTAGYDFLFIDMEHNSMSIDLAAQISVAAQDAGITTSGSPASRTSRGMCWRCASAASTRSASTGCPTTTGRRSRARRPRP